jgi:hypothetical protein
MSEPPEGFATLEEKVQYEVRHLPNKRSRNRHSEDIWGLAGTAFGDDAGDLDSQIRAYIALQARRNDPRPQVRSPSPSPSPEPPPKRRRTAKPKEPLRARPGAVPNSALHLLCVTILQMLPQTQRSSDVVRNAVPFLHPSME